MNRFGNASRVSPSALTAQRSLLLVVVALLVFIIYPTVKSLGCNDNPSSTDVLESPDITLDTLNPVPTINVEAPSSSIAEVASLLQGVAPQPLMLKRDNAQKNSSTPSWSNELYYVSAHRRVKSCMNFYGLFEFWYPGCDQTISNWEHFLSNHWDELGDAYRHHAWEILEDAVEGIARREPSNQSLESSVCRGVTLVPTLPKPSYSKPSRPKQSSLPVTHRLNSIDEFTGNHGPVASEGMGASSLEGHSQDITASTLGTVAADGNSCTVYPEDCKSTFALTNCTAERAQPIFEANDTVETKEEDDGDLPAIGIVVSDRDIIELKANAHLNSKEKYSDPDLEAMGIVGYKRNIIDQKPKMSFGRRKVNEGSTELDPIFAPMQHNTLTKPKPKPKPRPSGPSPRDQRTRALESEGSVTKNFAAVEMDRCPRICRGKRTIDQASTELDPACPPRLCNRPKFPSPAFQANDAINTEHIAERSGRSVSARDFEEDQRPGTSDSRAEGDRWEPMMNWDGSFRDAGHVKPHPKGHKGNAREVQEEAAQDSRMNRRGIPLAETVKRNLKDGDHPPFNGINTVLPGAQQPSLVFHSSPFSALQVQNVAKDCRGKTGEALNTCSKEVWTKNTRTLSIALVLGILSFLFLTLVVLDKIRRAKSRRASVPIFSKGSSPNGTEQMSERATTKYMPTSMDGANDGWTNWLMGKRESTRYLSPSTRVNVPRIPSLTLPKPTLATVRKFSGLGPDLEDMGSEMPDLKARWKSDSKLKWNTTL